MQHFSAMEDVPQQAMLALGFTALLFFVISPIVGALMDRTIARRRDFFALVLCFWLIFIAGFYGLGYLLYQVLPEGAMTRLQSHMVGLAAALAVMLFVAWVLRTFIFMGPEQSWLAQELEELEYETPMDARRREFMARRQRAREGGGKKREKTE